MGVSIVIACLGAAKAPAPITVEVPSSVDDTRQPCLCAPSPEEGKRPLLVLLHHWSHGYDTFDSTAWRAEAASRGWHVVVAHYRGPNNRPEACASPKARQDVLDAVAYMCGHYAVDRTRVYLAGESGGGHMAMVMAAHAPRVWAAVSAWCGISDLAAWHRESLAANRKYYKDIEAVVGGAPGSSAEVDAQLRYRSPVHHLANAKDLPLDISTGIHDGHTGSVPVHHTIDAFNVIAAARGEATVSEEEIRLLAEEKPLATSEEQDVAYGRAIHLRRYAGQSRVTVFEGGHEGLPGAACGWLAQHQKARIPIIYTTDLYHPHEDPDDHFDLMTLFALPELEVRAIIFDIGDHGRERPLGLPALQQVMHMTGKQVPYATGLTSNLESPEDTGEHQGVEAQEGVALILKTLRGSERPVTVFTTGSLRDVAAAYNREPGLFREKVSRLYINAGHSAGGGEWNVKLDPHAYVSMLRSGLPIYWLPCFGEAGKGASRGYASFWSFTHGDVLGVAPRAVQNYFIYALTKADPEQNAPVAALGAAPARATVDELWPLKRNMWCTAGFLHAAGWPLPACSFVERAVTVDDGGGTHVLEEGEGVRVHVLHVDGPAAYAPAMTGSLRALFPEVGSGA